MKAKRTKRKQLKSDLSSPADIRPIQISGYQGEKLIASDRTAEHWKARQIAASWRQSGLEVAIVEKTTL